MKAMRQILSDRMLATALAVVLAYLLAFQGFTGNLAKASTAIAAQDAFHVLCGSTGIVNADKTSTDDPLKRGTECPCASLCRLASSIAPFITTPGLLLLTATAPASQRIVFSSPDMPVTARRGLLPDARGPPSTS